MIELVAKYFATFFRIASYDSTCEARWLKAPALDFERAESRYLLRLSDSLDTFLTRWDY